MNFFKSFILLIVLLFAWTYFVSNINFWPKLSEAEAEVENTQNKNIIPKHITRIEESVENEVNIDIKKEEEKEEKFLYGISDDWKYAEVFIKLNDDNEKISYIYDLEKWIQINDKEKQKEIKIRSLKYSKEKFFTKTVKLDNDLEIYAEEVQGDKKLNIKIKQAETKEEELILSIDKPKCSTGSLWFYSSSDMKGIILAYDDVNCNQEKENIKVIGQNILKPKLSRFYNFVAMSYYKERDYNNAVVYFKKAIWLDDKYALAYFNVACTFSLLKEENKALYNLKIAIELEPDNYKWRARQDNDFWYIKDSERFKKLVW